tara:strand:- start:910 stop:1218 length:309 start_codon:yes stop_codon:yes gene_type:complete
MDNLDICKRIAKIEGVELLGPNKLNYKPANTMCAVIYNPLEDDALCFQLMIKYRMQLSRLPNLDYICKKQGVFVNINSTTKGIDSPNKAICLAIIELNKGKQ